MAEHLHDAEQRMRHRGLHMGSSHRVQCLMVYAYSRAPRRGVICAVCLQYYLMTVVLGGPTFIGIQGS